jgi:hypothetical protein
MAESISVRGRLVAEIEPDEWWTSERSTLGGRVEEGWR